MLDTSILTRGIGQRGPDSITPEIKVVQSEDTYGKFVIEPLERGYGITVGNPMRRMLLSSIEGTAITWVKIEGVLHEYSTIPHMREEVMEFLLNVKGMRIRSTTDRPGKMRLDIAGEGRVCAGDVGTSSDFEIVNPELHLATLDSSNASLSVEFNVEHGKGYQPVPQSDGVYNPLVGILPVDAIFNPVKKVNYNIERTRVGHVTDYERLVLEIWTDGTITPVEALRKSSEVLVNHFFLFSNLGREIEAGTDRPPITVSAEVYQTPIEKLDVSPRTLNCLKRAHITKVGQVLEMSNDDLLKIRNFGEKSLEELLTKLRAEGMLNEDEYRARTSGYNGVQQQPHDSGITIQLAHTNGDSAESSGDDDDGAVVSPVLGRIDIDDWQDDDAVEDDSSDEDDEDDYYDDDEEN